MTFQFFQFMTLTDYFFILPTIIINRNEQKYRENNLSIEFHFAIWHLRWFWMEDQE